MGPTAALAIEISIHAPARGATCILSVCNNIGDISIHAPARGATLLPPSLHLLQRYFNPRSREGSDWWMPLPEPPEELFQSTLPRGERQNAAVKIARYVKFQSTLPRGERPGCCGCWGGGRIISIHAPARGATRYMGEKQSYRSISIHAPARGATLFWVKTFCRLSDFNPRSREGSDSKYRQNQPSFFIYIH